MFLNLLFDFISPKKCYNCKKEWKFLCEDCVKIFKEFEEICYVCKKYSKNCEVHKNCHENIFYDKVIILKHYKNNIIKKLIKDWKFYNKTEILEEFSLYLHKKFLKYEKCEDFEKYLVLPIPSYFLRKLKRWYNSSEVLSKKFAEISKINYKKNILKKIRQTKQQSKLDKLWRLKNLENSFKINDKFKNFIKWKNLIILDDVISTWTTLNEVSKILKQNWAKKIIWLVVASD